MRAPAIFLDFQIIIHITVVLEICQTLSKKTDENTDAALKGKFKDFFISWVIHDM